MRLSSAQLFNQSITSVLQKQTATSKILDQLSSGKKVNTAGDDPVASQGIDNLNQKNDTRRSVYEEHRLCDESSCCD